MANEIRVGDLRLYNLPSTITIKEGDPVEVRLASLEAPFVGIVEGFERKSLSCKLKFAFVLTDDVVNRKSREWHPMSIQLNTVVVDGVKCFFR